MVEHDMGVVFDLADRISVLVYGEIIATDDARAHPRERRRAGRISGDRLSCLKSTTLHAYYGKSHILQGISFRVGEGEIISLLGRNGAGRSTTIKTIMGQVPPGRSDPVQGRAHRRAQAARDRAPRPGLRSGRPGEIFPELTVRENLMLGVKSPGRNGHQARWSFEDAFALFPLLRERADAPGGVLSGGEQQMLTICRTLMGDPDLIMVDEPTEGLAPKLVELVRELLETIAQRGIAILLIEQKLTIALAISHRVYVMGHGRIVFEGTPQDLRRQ